LVDLEKTIDDEAAGKAKTINDTKATEAFDPRECRYDWTPKVPT
jgi:hypothetical protein